MKLGELHIDPEVDALYIDVADGYSRRTEVVSPGIMIDYDENDRIVGVEVLYLSKRFQTRICNLSWLNRSRQPGE